MKLEVFTLIIETIQKQTAKSFELSKLGVEVLDYEEGWIGATTLLLNVYYGRKGGDWIDWYLYEREDSENPAFDENNQPICYDIPSLWSHVEKLRVSEDFEEFELPKKTQITEDDLLSLFTKRVHNG